MRQINPNFDQLRRSIGTQGYARSASYLPEAIAGRTKSLDIGARFRELQAEERAAGRQDRLVNALLGGVQAGVQLGSAISNLIDQRDLQDEKLLAIKARSDFEKATREAILSGKSETVTNPDGTVDFKVPDALKTIYEQYDGALKEKKYSKRVEGVAREHLQSAFDSASNGFWQNEAVKIAKERDINSDQLLAGSIQDAINTGSDESIVKTVRSEEWRSKEIQDIRISGALTQAKVGRADKELTSIATQQGAAAALSAFDPVKGAFTTEQQEQLTSSIAKADKAAYASAEAQATQTYSKLTTDQVDGAGNVVQQGYSPAEAIRGIEATLTGPDERKAKVLDYLRKQQDTAEWDRAYDNYTESTAAEDLNELKAKRKEYDPGGSEYDRFAGLKNDSLKRVQEMFDRKIEQMEKDQKGEDGDFGQAMALAFMAYQRGVPGPNGKAPNAQATISRITNLIDSGGPAEAGLKYISKIQAGGKPEYEPALNAYGATMESLISQQKDPASKGRLRQMQLETMDMAGSMIGKGNFSVDDIQKALNTNLDVEFAKNFDKNVRNAIDRGVMSTVTDPTGSRQIAGFKAQAQTGAIDDLVYVDDSGNTRYTRGGQGFKNMMSKSEEILSDMGITVKKGSTQFVRQGESDVGADFTTKGSDGNTYTLRTDDGKNLYAAKLTEKGWVKVAEPKKVEVTPPDVKSTKETAARELDVQAKQGTASAENELGSLKDDKARRLRIIDMIASGRATEADINRAGYNRNGTKRQ